MIELENWCAYFSKKVFAPSPTNFLPQSFGKTSVFDKAQSNEKDKDKDKDKDKNKDIGTNNMDLVWQAKHGYSAWVQATAQYQLFSCLCSHTTGQVVFKNLI